MIASSAARIAARQLARPASRSLHSTTSTRGAHGNDYEYLHAKYMYNLRNKPASKLKAGSLIVGGVVVGAGIPLFAVEFNQRKAGLK